MRKVLSLFLTLVLFFTLVSPVAARDGRRYHDNEVPEQDGDYELADHPQLHLRIHIHDSKPSKSVNSLTCTVSDPDSAAVTGPAGWHLPATWTYNLNTNSVQNLPTIANLAFSGWSAASAGKVLFTRGANTSVNRAQFDSKNIIAWGRAPSGALAVTYTWYYPDTGLAAEEDTIFNSRLPWSWTPYSATACANPSRYDIQDILTHETGHWMGLNDFYDASYVNNTMYGYGSTGEIKKDTLTTGDIAGVHAIYP